MQKMEAHKVSMKKTLFKKILPSKKLLRTLCSDEKFSKTTISKLGISSFHVETNSKNHHYFCKGNTNIFKSTGLVFVTTSLATDKSPTDDQLMGNL